MARKVLTGLRAEEYEHPSDKKAMEILKKTPGIDAFGKAIFKFGFEKISRIQYEGSSIKVTSVSFPELYKQFTEACRILDLEAKPDFYLYRGYAIDALTIGIDKPMVIFSSGAIDCLSEKEFLYMLGHELGHIKSGHCLYHMMVSLVPIIGDILGSVLLGIGNAVAQGLNLALLSWYRKSELTADRAGLLVVQESNAVFEAMMKLSGVPQSYYDKTKLNTFIEQAREYKALDSDHLNKIAKLYDMMNLNHPLTVMRASEILKWIESNEPKNLFKNRG
ncbi:MAG: M48 family metallopeptidase [Desulfitobacteriaceae bacterium]